MEPQDGQDQATSMENMLAPLLQQLGESAGASRPESPQQPQGQTAPTSDESRLARPEASPPAGEARQPDAPPSPGADQAGQPTVPAGMLDGMPQPVLLELLLRRLESGQIHRHEMEQFQRRNQDETVARELMWIVYAIDLLETHRFRLVDHLRTVQPGP